MPGFLRKIKGVKNLRMDFAQDTHFPFPRDQLCGATGMEGAALSRLQMPLLDSQLAQQDFDHTLQIEEIHGAHILLHPRRGFPWTSHGNSQTTHLTG